MHIVDVAIAIVINPVAGDLARLVQMFAARSG
jgi:hypothetical protein